MNRMMAWSVGMAVALGAVNPARAGEPAPEGFDWGIWKAIVVHDGKRLKPFDTHARETILDMTGRMFFKPEGLDTFSPADVADWKALAEALKAPANGERVESEDGRHDRFRAGEAGSRNAVHRIRDLVSPDLRRALRDTDVTGDVALQKQIDKKDQDLAAAKRKLFERQADNRSLDELRHAAAEANDKDILALLDEAQTLKDKWLRINAVKAKLIIELNALLQFAQLYDGTAWIGTALPEAAQKLVAEGPKKLTHEKLARLNHYLVHSAFGGALNPAPFAGLATVREEKYHPVELYLTWLFTWQGWDSWLKQAPDPATLDDEMYWKLHRVDAWDRTPTIQAHLGALQPLLKPEVNGHVSAYTIARYPDFQRVAFDIMRDLQNDRRSKDDLSENERRLMTVATNGMRLMEIRSGLQLAIGPRMGSDSAKWLPLAEFWLTPKDKLKEMYDAESPTKLQAAFAEARRAFLAKEPAAFNAASKEFAAVLQGFGEKYSYSMKEERRKMDAEMPPTSPSGLSHLFDWLDRGKDWDAYPSPARIDREIFYNEFNPFEKAWIIAAIAVLILATSLGIGNPLPYRVGFVALVASMGLMAYGTYLRIAIAGRPPVTNMFETITWASFIAGLLGVVLGLIYNQKILPFTAAVLVCLANLLATNMPLEMGGSIEPLQPVLRSQKWLIVHVMTIVASYGAFMEAWLLGNIGLVYYLIGKDKPENIKPLANFSYRAMQVGVLLLAAGTLLGGWWAADSWGRFWGWDPKEVWALVALLGYLAVLHGRFVGMKNFGLMVGAVGAFNLVVLSWYGVNFIFPAGLHAYAINSGGQPYVIGCMLANLVFLGIVCAKRAVTNRLAASAVAVTPPRPRSSEAVVKLPGEES